MQFLFSPPIYRVGAPEAMQHPDHPDREREHGAGGEGEGGKEETGPKDRLSKLQIHPIINNSNYFKLSIKDNILLLLLFLIHFFPSQAQKRKSEGTPDGRGRRKKLKL